MTMPNRINLVACVRDALIARGNSTIQVVNAVNAALGELECVSTTERTGSGSVSKSKYRVSDSTARKFEGTRTTPLHFDAWHTKIEAACKVATIDDIGIPIVFEEWLDAMIARKAAKQVEGEAQVQAETQA